MKVYHGSTQAVEYPLVGVGRENLDFGKGFSINVSLIDVLVWNKYTRVVMQLAERLNISPEKALHLFYNSKVYALLLNKQYPLITLSDAYITDEIILELQQQ